MQKNAGRKPPDATRKRPAKASTHGTGSQPQEYHRGNRYGRSEAARQAVLEAANNLLIEIGFAAVTIEGIGTLGNRVVDGG